MTSNARPLESIVTNQIGTAAAVTVLSTAYVEWALLHIKESTTVTRRTGRSRHRHSDKRYECALSTKHNNKHNTYSLGQTVALGHHKLASPPERRSNLLMRGPYRLEDRFYCTEMSP